MSRSAHFAKHYLEMVLVMVAGMVVVLPPVEGLLRLGGASVAELPELAPGPALLGMGVAMSLPMVAWMAYRGHSRGATLEMGASMVVPGVLAAALLELGIVEGFDVLMLVEHALMLPAMLVVMLLRPDEYACG